VRYERGWFSSARFDCASLNKELDMYRRTALVVIVAAVVALPAARADKQEKIHDGIVLSVTADTLAMSDANGKNEHSHQVGPGAAITIDGKPAKLPDLAKGDKVKVAVGQDGKVVRIMATRAAKKAF
jgi:hypothetical protein